MKSLYLNKEILSNENVTNNGLFAYMGLISLARKEYSKNYICAEMMCYEFFGEPDGNMYKKGIRNMFSDGMDNLAESGIVSMRKLSPFEYIVDFSSIPSSKFYTMVYMEEIKAILGSMRIDGALNAIRYFITIVGSFNNSNKLDSKYRGKIGGLTLERLADESNISIMTAIKNNSVLEKLGLLFIFHSDDFFYDKFNNRINYAANAYCRYCDKELAGEYVNENIRSHGYRKIAERKESSNRLRSLSQKYNTVVGGKVYSYTEEELNEILEYCRENGKDENPVLAAIANL